MYQKERANKEQGEGKDRKERPTGKFTKKGKKKKLEKIYLRDQQKRGRSNVTVVELTRQGSSYRGEDVCLCEYSHLIHSFLCSPPISLLKVIQHHSSSSSLFLQHRKQLFKCIFLFLFFSGVLRLTSSCSSSCLSLRLLG